MIKHREIDVIQKMILKTGNNQKHSKRHTIVGVSTKRYI